MRTLIFDLWGEWGHFRKYYSTSSPLTFSVITPTAAFGVIGAILGLSKEQNEYLRILNQAKTWIGVGLNQPVKKTTMGINYVNTKGNIWVPKQRKEGARTPLRVEYLRNPHFRLYVSMQDSTLYNQLVQRVYNQENYYTLSLGLSELLAHFRYVDEVYVHSVDDPKQPVELHSIVPVSLIQSKGVPFIPGKKYKKERLPISMDEHRVVHRYEECLFETQGTSVCVQVKSYWAGNGYRFIFCN